MKKSLTAAALCLALSVPAYAAMTDFYYTGRLDPATGAPVAAGSGQEDARSSSRVALSDTMYYDRNIHSFVYPAGDGVGEIRSNAADGMVTRDPVSLYADTDLPLTVYRSGEALEDPNLAAISDVGEYVVTVNNGGGTENVFRFTIVGERTSLPGGYALPEGFYITDATVDDEEAYYERTYIDMEEEGLYQVEYFSPDASVRMTLKTTIDRTPPDVVLQGREDAQGRFHSAVQVSGLEEGGTVVLTRDGEAVQFPYDGRLTDTGVYTLQVSDSAGNAVTKQFTILLYLDLNSLVFFGLVCLSLAGVAGYILFNRRRLKII